MKRKLIIWLFLILPVSNKIFARVLIVNNNSNRPAGHYQLLQEAVIAGNNGDTIYVVGSFESYGSVSLSAANKSFVFIGEGYRPQKDFNFSSKVAGFDFNSPSGNGNGTKIFGFEITGRVGIGGPTCCTGQSLEIAYNYFQPGSDIIAGDNCNIHDNIFNVGSAGAGIALFGPNTHIHNNIFSSSNGRSNIISMNNCWNGYSNNTVNNNHFLSGATGYVFGCANSFLYENNLFYNYSIADSNSVSPVFNSIFNNNLVYNNGNNFVLFGSNTSTTGINFAGIQPSFTNPTSNFTFDFHPYDFTLQSTSAGHNVGTDGKDIGAFGGTNPFSNFTGMQNIPAVKKLDILANSIIGINDSLKFHVHATNRSSADSQFSKIVSAEYFFDTEPGQGNGIPLIIILSVSIDSILSIAHGLTFGKHVVGFRVMNTNGVWSLPEMKDFRVCTVSGPLVDFDYYVSGQDVILDNTSKIQDSCKWTFSDGYSSSQTNLTHHFNTPAIYNVQLRSFNACDTVGNVISKAVTIKGVSSISPNKGGNIGVVTILITGAGFTSSTTVKLFKDGVYLLPVDSSTFEFGRIKIQASFNLNGIAVGNWDVIIDVPGDTAYNISGGFTVEEGRFANPGVILIGPNSFRHDEWSTYSISVGNSGNIDAVGVAVWFAVPAYLDVNLLFSVQPIIDENFNWGAIPEYILVDKLFSNDTLYKVYSYVIPFIPPNDEVTLKIRLKSRDFSPFNICFWASRPYMLNDATQINSRAVNSGCFIDPQKLDCILHLASLAGELVTSIDELSCLTGFIGADLKIFNNASCSSYPQSLGSGIRNNFKILGEAAVTCKESIVEPLERWFWMKASLEKLFDIYKELDDAANLDDEIRKQIEDAKKNCPYGFLANDRNCYTVSHVTSIDPNDKLGGSGVLNSKYLNSQKVLKYSIRFENVATATAPAQTVIITDTLNNTNLDLSTLQLTLIGFADTIISIPPGKQSFTTDIDMRPGIPLIARVSAFLNQATHVLTSRFESLDPITKEPTDSVLLGFLLPNDSTGRGEGFISYSVKAKAGIATGTVINNKADIYFDNNAPIATPTWTNIIDDLKPQSQVNPLLAFTGSDSINVKWSGNDNGPANIYGYNVYYKTGNGEWKLWKYNTSLNGDVFIGKVDSTYSFFSVAIDSALNVEDAALTADATTTIAKPFQDSVCNGDIVFLGSGLPSGVASYQWQIDTGTGYTNLTNSATYIGATSDTLKIIGAPTSFYGYKYRCIVNKSGVLNASVTHILHFKNKWTGTESTAWEVAGNWSCNSIPDENTDVIIYNDVVNHPLVSSNAICRSVTAANGASLLVKTGFKLTLTGKSQ